jgi:hypothetical protein
MQAGVYREKGEALPFIVRAMRNSNLAGIREPVGRRRANLPGTKGQDGLNARWA